MMLAWRGEGSKGVEGPIDNGGGGGFASGLVEVRCAPTRNNIAPRWALINHRAPMKRRCETAP